MWSGDSCSHTATAFACTRATCLDARLLYPRVQSRHVATINIVVLCPAKGQRTPSLGGCRIKHLQHRHFYEPGGRGFKSCRARQSQRRGRSDATPFSSRSRSMRPARRIRHSPRSMPVQPVGGVPGASRARVAGPMEDAGQTGDRRAVRAFGRTGIMRPFEPAARPARASPGIR